MGLDEADGLILVGWMSICWYNFADWSDDCSYADEIFDSS